MCGLYVAYFLWLFCLVQCVHALVMFKSQTKSIKLKTNEYDSENEHNRAIANDWRCVTNIFWIFHKLCHLSLMGMNTYWMFGEWS